MIQRGAEQGSALLITMILVTVVGSIAFAIGASTITSFRQQTQIEDSLNAYAAATAGLEDGLLRWRFDKDTETPRDRGDTGKESESGSFDCPADRPTTSSTYYDRINLTTGEVQFCIDPDEEPAPDPTQIVYDIKIQYKLEAGEAEVVNEQTTSSGTVPALGKDQAVEYDVSELEKVGDGRVNLGWIFDSFRSSDRTIQFEVFSLDADGNVISASRQLFDPFISSTIKDKKADGRGGTLVYDLKDGTKVRIRPYGRDLEQYQLEPTSETVAIDSRTTSVSVVGYFGSSKRKLQLELDRNSGAILPIYDYALFSETTGLTP